MAMVRQLLIGLLSSSVLYSALVPALGLGDITLRSALSQPLDAEIELLDVGDLTDADMRVRLAPADVFSRSGVERLSFFSELRFTPQVRGGKTVVRVASAQAVREPYLNFIVEVARPNGKLYREYTLLLDPPNSAAYASLAASSPSPVAAPAAPRTAAAAPARPKILPAAQQGNSHRVVSGESLWTIATQLTAGSGQSAQGLINDLHALNPQAFINGDINRLRAGAQLLLPDSIASTSPVAAEPDRATGFLQVVEDSDTAPAVSAELLPDELIEEQARVEQELASQTTQTLQLQQSLAQLDQQVQQLREQMAVRDQLIAGLQAELAVGRASAEAAAAAAPAVISPPIAAKSGSHWLAIIAGLLVLLLVAVAALFWRSKKPAEPLPEAHVLTPSLPETSVTPNEPVAAVALNVGGAPRAGPVWPTAGEDALQSANMYIAYGRLSEAATTLRKAWEAQPQRSDISFRLLEVLALLGDGQGFVAHEALVRASGFNPVRIDELKTRYPELTHTPPTRLLDDAVLHLDDFQAQPFGPADADAQLNLDEMSLDVDWDLVSPFAPTVSSKIASKAEGDGDGQAKDSDIFELPGGRDAHSPFAQSMLVEEASHDSWQGDELSVVFLDDFDALADDHDNLAKLNTALAYIEQGSLDSACQILNEVINEGDEEQKLEARQLLAKIA